MPAQPPAHTRSEPRALHLVARFAILAAASTTVLAALATLWWPFGWDQGIFAWIGGATAGGGLPYRDAWDVKGPLTFQIRVFDLILLAVAAASIRHIVAARAARGAATGAALLYALAYLGFGYWHTAQPDGWVAMLALAGRRCSPTSARSLAGA